MLHVTMTSTSAPTTELPTRRTRLSPGDSNENILGRNCSCSRIKDQCCLCVVSTGGYYALVVFAIYVCAKRFPYLAGIVFIFGIVILPLGLKLCWYKVQKWQAKKQTLQQNAETFYRLSVVGREREGNQTRTCTTRALTVQSNQSVATISNTDRVRSLDENFHFNVSRTQLPPAYEQACITDLPPSYEEAVQAYGLPNEETNTSCAVNSTINEL